ncbi:hypothetical protein [Cupriavidus sp. UYPR2.512]|uniref:hypothetical protein n=1 Tax=Cupriavidus sp. UYPR2.512 TaxID=1080187 RepID=UPI00035DBD37|nr:hypothetical protein [Cupriavidus sp. UYPR2.512]UIF89431.1 hypothetical protein KAF44_29620 [Cupriavidus necator]
MELENARFVVVELWRVEDGTRDEIRIFEAIPRSKITEVALLNLADVEDSAGCIDWIAVPMPGSHKLRDLARTNDLFHLNDFQDSLV